MSFSIAATFAIVLIAMIFSGYRRRKDWRNTIQSLLGQSAQSLLDHKQRCQDAREVVTSATHTMNSLQMAQLDTLCHEIDAIVMICDDQLQRVNSLRVFVDSMDLE